MRQTGHCIVGRSQQRDLGQIKWRGNTVEKTKPDLMAATGTQRPGGSKRILAQLEHGPRQPAHTARAAGWSIDGWTVSLFALLLLMCSVAWLMHDKTVTPKTFRRDYSSGSSSSVVRRAAESRPAVEQPATIVNEATPHIRADDNPAPATQASSGTEGSDTADATARSMRTAAATPRPSTPAARATAATTAATPAARTATATTPAAGQAATASPSDTDVTLLTALMAHTSKPAAVTPERPRDVVERQEGDTTAQLLARCKQLGLIEGMLCRSRICSGRWEADAACRAPSH
jgi:hypothetical protein